MNKPLTYQGGEVLTGKVSWRSPSNIALVKYWGKKENQLPLAPSVSMTLNRSFSQTSVTYSPSPTPGAISFEFLFEGQPFQAFALKIGKYLDKLAREIPSLKQHHLHIESSNSFPHSAGIASSASAMSALALCILSMDQNIREGNKREDFLKESSRVARQGSGSASRSVFPQWALWGETPLFAESSQEYAIPIQDQVHPVFNTLQDSILIVHSGVKAISSSRGHELMNNHPFLQQRIEQVHANLESIVTALQTGDMASFIEITENEALSLHALMKSSTPGFILTKPKTLEIIEKLYLFREKTRTEICFTLDAGPNVHLLYPLKEKEKVTHWLQQEVLELCENGQWIDDAIGMGPQMLFNK